MKRPLNTLRLLRKLFHRTNPASSAAWYRAFPGYENVRASDVAAYRREMNMPGAVHIDFSDWFRRL